MYTLDVFFSTRKFDANIAKFGDLRKALTVKMASYILLKSKVEKRSTAILAPNSLAGVAFICESREFIVHRRWSTRAKRPTLA